MPDLLVRDAELLVTMTGDEIVGGWVAVTNGVVAAVGDRRSARKHQDRPVTPGSRVRVPSLP